MSSLLAPYGKELRSQADAMAVLVDAEIAKLPQPWRLYFTVQVRWMRGYDSVWWFVRRLTR